MKKFSLLEILEVCLYCGKSLDETEETFCGECWENIEELPLEEEDD